MDTTYVRNKTIPKIAENKVKYLHFRYLNMLVTTGTGGQPKVYTNVPTNKNRLRPRNNRCRSFRNQSMPK